MDRGAERATVPGVTKSRTRLRQLGTHASLWPGSSFPRENWEILVLNCVLEFPKILIRPVVSQKL